MSAPLPSLFSPAHWQQIEPLLKNLDTHQALWLSGYLAGQGGQAPATVASAPVATASGILIAHGGETGNGRGLAQKLAENLRADGRNADVVDLAELRVRQLGKRDYLLLICSTHGDGDPPEPAQPFFEALLADNAPKLPNLHYSVLALGDSTYEHFCVAGKQLDERLAALGATRLHPRQDCDVDFEAPAASWSQAVTQALAQLAPASAPVAAPALFDSVATSAQPYSKQHPLNVEVLENVCLTHPNRSDAIHHLEVELTGDDLGLEPGDAVGVLADNPPQLVAALLDATALPAENAVTVAGESLPLVQALRQHLDLTIPGTRFLEYWAELSAAAPLRQLCGESATAQRQYLKQVQVLDIIHQYPAQPAAQPFVDALRPLQPRLYDVANSLHATPDELHLNVKAWSYAFGNRQEAGIASHYLAALAPGDSIRLYPHRNTRFHLPEAPQAPLILIAESTGIAPFRAFVQELALRDTPPPCWLTFIERHFEDDFLYQTEWQNARGKGHLQYIDSLFTDEQPELSPAARILENAERLAQWLEQGAHLYLCGDKDLLSACESALGAHYGAERWKALNKAKRIHRNLY